MRLSVLQENLARALATVNRAIDSRPTLPVLANVRLEASGSRLTISATNLELSISTQIGAKVERDGAITLPAKMLAELVATLSPERVDLTQDGFSVELRCGTTRASLRGIAATEFPLLPEPTDDTLTIPGKALKQALQETLYAAAKEDNRPILTGVLWQLADGTLTLAAADGYRLAVRTLPVEMPHNLILHEIVIPARSLVEVARLNSDEDITVTLPGEREIVTFSDGFTTVTTQILEGRFPDFGAIIPKAYSTSATVYTTDLLRACKRAEIFARDSANSTKLIVTPPNGKGGPGEIMVVGKSAERGDNEGMLDASVEGDPLEASFNVRYLIDTLASIADERVVIESQGAAHPGVIRPEGRGDLVNVVMPMSTTR